jgi:hypothetical protein
MEFIGKSVPFSSKFPVTFTTVPPITPEIVTRSGQSRANPLSGTHSVTNTKIAPFVVTTQTYQQGLAYPKMA